MSQTMITFRMDQELKKSMEQTCADMGLTMTAAFTIFAKMCIRDRASDSGIQKKALRSGGSDGCGKSPAFRGDGRAFCGE